MKIFLNTILGLSLLTTLTIADVNKGQKLYAKYYKETCGLNGGELASKFTQEEWSEGNLTIMINESCEDNITIKDKYREHIQDFMVEFANDSGNVPSC